MVRICFVLDLRTLPPPVLEDLKQSLMMLGNYYALALPNSDDSSDTTASRPLLDHIGLFYISREINTAYSQEGGFNLHEFHHALNDLPTDNFSTEFNEFQSLFREEIKLEAVIDEVVLDSWQPPEIPIKIIVICCCFFETLDQETRDSILDTTDRNVSLEFVFLERKASGCGDVTVNINHVEKQIGDLRNCKFLTCVPDLHVLSGLAKRWFQELKVEKEEQLKAHFTFKIDLLGSLNQLSCNLFTFFNPITDGFSFCKTCRCHGIPIGQSDLKLSQKSSHCPITKNKLETLEIWENSVKIGEQTTLYMPSLYSIKEVQKVSSPINFNVIQRTDLGSLSEGVIIGTSYVVTSSSSTHIDYIDKSKINNQVFLAVCGVLNSLDQGLVCSSNCNLETLMESSFKCYYLLLPSEPGLMILRRLLASEEFLPFPDPIRFIHCDEYKEIENTVKESLLKIEINNYNPVQHERGFHQELNLLVKQSLLHISVKHPKSGEESSESNLNLKDSSSGGADTPVAEEGTSQMAGKEEDMALFLKLGCEQIVVEELPDSGSLPHSSNSEGDQLYIPPLQNKKNLEGTSQMAGKEETMALFLKLGWEKIVVEELPDSGSLPHSSTSEADQLDIPPLQNKKNLDQITSSILERLEIPREKKRKAVSSTTSSSIVDDVCPLAKRTLTFRSL